MGQLVGEERDWAHDRSLHQPWARHPHPPQVQEAPLTHVLRGVQGGFPVQGVHEEAAHGRVQGGLLGLGAPQPCQETCGDPQPPNWPEPQSGTRDLLPFPTTPLVPPRDRRSVF